MKKGYELPRFKKAMVAHEDALPGGTYWRYRNGILPPPFGKLLVENPDLALALAADAADLARQRIVAGDNANNRRRKHANKANSAQQGDDTAQLGLL
jgi:hypothetical protein